MGRITDTFSDKIGHVCCVKVKTQNGTLERPITKLCLLKDMTWQVRHDLTRPNLLPYVLTVHSYLYTATLTILDLFLFYCFWLWGILIIDPKWVAIKLLLLNECIYFWMITLVYLWNESRGNKISCKMNSWMLALTIIADWLLKGLFGKNEGCFFLTMNSLQKWTIRILKDIDLNFLKKEKWPLTILSPRYLSSYEFVWIAL